MKENNNFLINCLNKYKLGLIMTLICIFIVILDLITKVLTDKINVTIINGFLTFKSSYNTGAAWSILSNHTWLLVLLSILFVGAIFVANWFYKGKTIFYSLSLGLLLGGAIGNLYDRIFYGYVRDFIRVDFIDFPIFNIADCAITIGVILLCIYFVFFAKSKINSKEKLEKNNNDYKDNING